MKPSNVPIRGILVVTSLLIMDSSSHAGMLVLDADKVIGIDGLTIGGTYFDVRFNDSSFNDLFGTIDVDKD